MSLVQSLFGGEKEASNKTLFETQIKIPERNVKEAPKAQAIIPPQAAEAFLPIYGPEPPPRSSSDEESEEISGDESTVAANDTNESSSDRVSNDEQDQRTIFVGNLPLSFLQQKHRLRHLFSDCGGPIVSTRFRSVATTGVKIPADQKGNQRLVQKVCVNSNRVDTDAKQSVSAYVVFANMASVEVALQLNNTAVPDDKGKARHIRVDRAQPSYDPARTVFVGNLPYGADEESLASYFRGLQGLDVQAVRIVRDKETHLCKGFGYVMLEDKQAVMKALEHPDERTNYMGRVLRVQVCGKRYKSQNPDAANRPKKKEVTPSTAVGAVRRVLAKQDTDKKKRARSTGKKKGPHKRAGGVSKRAAVEAKVNQRIKKIEKRISKGMGKARKA